ncbi:flagellar assembly peptidoglycan hydrolase FlgJ [Shewanella sp. WXL01]|uniref:flagellar assembly peptidoglycan hydrolase FlgJ n=1 Tax=Shewanella sp. WXL01 TaxID=2709721 RepID=UPI00143841B2|nr:flagellar assembly peptidoglycan hydrolase FlgJ [Shewanella sp. WXL01]NKF50207.1 flagellar assembly peptidoglycan hydrolase FlgJ [Shewanella sp. WXL01]
MDKLSNSSHFLDLGGLDSLRAQAQKDEKGALTAAAKQFEGIFIQMLMKSMRDANSAFKADSPFNSQTTEFFEQMRDQQMSVDLSSKGMLGLAELMVQQLDPASSNVKPASVLRNGTDSDVTGLATQAVDYSRNKLRINTAQPAQADIDNLQNTGLSSSFQAGIAGAQAAGFNPDEEFNAQQQMQSILQGNIGASQALATNYSSAMNAGFGGKLQSGKSLPNSSSSMQGFDTPEQFVSTLYPYAKKAAQSLGTTPEVLIAQSALETGWGQKVIKGADGAPSNNLFNIKADKRWQGDKAQVSTLEYEQGVAVKQKADFRVYDSIEHSFNDFVEFISGSERYQQATNVAAKPEQFIKELQQAGYATDPQYANKVIRVMQSVTQSVKSMLPGENN